MKCVDTVIFMYSQIAKNNYARNNYSFYSTYTIAVMVKSSS